MIDELSTEVKEKIASIPGLYDIKTSMEQGAPEVNISIDRLKSGIYGVDIASVASQIKEKLNGKTASNFESEGEPIDIEIKVPEVSLDELQNVEIVQGEKKYRLGEIAEVSITTAPKEINRSNQNRIGKVTAMLEKGYTLGSVTPEIKAQLKACLVGSEMCIRDRSNSLLNIQHKLPEKKRNGPNRFKVCPLL